MLQAIVNGVEAHNSRQAAALARFLLENRENVIVSCNGSAQWYDAVYMSKEALDSLEEILLERFNGAAVQG